MRVAPLALLAIGCVPRAPKESALPAVIAVEPAPATAVTAPLVATPDDAGSDGREATAASNPCRGSSFDLAELPKACRTNEDAHVPHYLTAKLAADAVTVAPGEEVGVTLTIMNPANDAATLVIDLGCEELEVQAFKGATRADFVNAACGFGKGCGTANYRLELEPHGVLTRHLRYRARVKKIGKDCKLTESPLPPAPYSLHVDSNPAFVLHDRVARLQALLVVKR